MSRPKPHLDTPDSHISGYEIASTAVRVGAGSAFATNLVTTLAYGVKAGDVESMIHYVGKNALVTGGVATATCYLAAKALTHYQSKQDRYYTIAQTSKMSLSNFINNSVAARQTNKFKHILRKAAMISMFAGATAGIVRCSCTPAPAGSPTLATTHAIPKPH